MLACCEDERYDNDLAQRHDPFQPLEIEILEDDTYKRHGIYRMTGEHEISATIGGIDAKEKIVHICRRRPSTGQNGTHDIECERTQMAREISGLINIQPKKLTVDSLRSARAY